MNLFLFFFAIIISFLVVRIGGAAFELTGMEKDHARFQSLSCFSGTGFTTSEAELVTSHPQRRKIASYLMILGNAGLVTLIATFANTIRPVDVLQQFMFFSIPLPIPAHYSPFINIAVIAVGVLLLFKLFSATHIMDRFTAKAKEQMAEKKIITEEKVTELLFTHEGYGVSQFDIHEDSPMADKKLKDLKLKESEVQILLIERPKGPVVTPKGNETLEAGDTLICFGKLETIRQLA